MYVIDSFYLKRGFYVKFMYYFGSIFNDVVFLVMNFL